MMIKVTQELIYDGIRKDCLMCPVARAMTTATGKCVVVGQAWWRYSGMEKVHRLPEHVANFITDFDVLGKASPIEFEVEP